MIKNKKGNVSSIIWIILILFFVMFLGVILAFGSVIVKWTFDEAMPTLTSIGMVGSTNMSSIGSTVLTPVNNVVQSFTWLAGVVYAMALIGCLGMAFAFRFTGSKWLMGFFICCMLLLVVSSIFISNIYEEFYSDGSDIGTALHNLPMLSYLLLYSPLVMCIIGFVCGIIMFTGEGNDEVI